MHSQDALDLIPTPQQIVAQSVGLSNASVSRIVRGRYLRVYGTHGRTIPLAALCVPMTVGGRIPQQIQQLLLQLVAEESPDQSYTDEQLVQLKLRYHLAIARRRVAKYRKAAGTVPTSMRRRRKCKSQISCD